MLGQPDLGQVIQRLQAYQIAGADVLYAPGLVSLDDIALLVREVDRPVNVLIGLRRMPVSTDDLFGVGVRRVSTGASLARAALGEFMRGVGELREHGTATYSAKAVSGADLNGLFSRRG